MKNYQIILTAILSFGASISILNGTAQQYVYFAGEMNEMFTFIIAFTMGILSLISIDYKKLINGLN